MVGPERGRICGFHMALWPLFRKRTPPLLQRSIDDMRHMLETADRMFRAACAYLLDQESLQLDLRSLDEVINERERAIRSSILQHISVDPYSDTAFSLTLLSVVQDAERIGDLAKSLAKAAALAIEPLSSSHAEMLKTLRDAVAGLFDTTSRAFVSGDVELARSVMERNDRIKLQTTDFIHSLAHEIHVTVNEAVILAMAARMIGRVGSHLSNIASTIAMPFDQVRRSPTWPVEMDMEDEEDQNQR